MKKVICLVLSLVLVFALCGCEFNLSTGENDKLTLKDVELEKKYEELEEEKEELQEEVENLKEELNKLKEEEKVVSEKVEEEITEEIIKKEVEEIEEEFEEVINEENSDKVVLHYIKDGEYIKEETTYKKENVSTLRIEKLIGQKYKISGILDSIERLGDNKEIVTFDFKGIDLGEEEYSEYLKSLAVTFILSLGAEEIYYSVDGELTSLFNPDGLYITKNMLLTNWSEIMQGE